MTDYSSKQASRLFSHPLIHCDSMTDYSSKQDALGCNKPCNGCDSMTDYSSKQGIGAKATLTLSCEIP